MVTTYSTLLEIGVNSMGLFDDFYTWLGRDKNVPKKPETPETAPTKKPGVVDYVKAWQLFRLIPIHRLGGVLGASTLLVFFAISGVLAWIVVFAKFMLALGK